MLTSKFVDPIAQSTRKSTTVVASSEELELIRDAREYAELQKKKSVKWFVCHGAPLPTDDDVANVVRKREEKIEGVARSIRSEDRQRTDGPEFEGAVIVPTTKHPLYQSDEAAADLVPSFATVAVGGIAGRRTVFTAFEQLCRIVLLRNRVDSRLQKVARSAAKANQTELSGSVDVPRISLLEMTAFQTMATSDGGALAPISKEEVSAADVKLYHQKELRVPFEFKNRSYRQLKFSEHQYSNADLPETVPVLYAGVQEVPADANGEIPAVEHFVQPLVTLETYPMPAFAYVSPEPWRFAIQSQLPQRLSDGGFLPPHFSTEFGKRPSSATMNMDTTYFTVLGAPTPSPLTCRDENDELSDSDGDEDIPRLHPANLDQVRQWLPPFVGTSSPSAVPKGSHVKGGPVVVGATYVNLSLLKRRSALTSTTSKIREDMPAELQLML